MLSSAARRRELDHVHAQGNDIRYVPDLDQFGVDDLWAVADIARGDDCDGISLWKRQELIKRGWTIDDLSLAVCLTEAGQGHMVLLAQLGDETLVLDNRRDLVVRWDEETGYRWIKRQRFGTKAWEACG